MAIDNRVIIGFFGCRNVGKSSLVNKVTNQEMSVVSDIKGTTTDPVKKTMELLPIGPVTIVDTPGFDDEGYLGEKRVEQTKKILHRVDIAVLVSDASRDFNSIEKELIKIFKEKEIPYIIAKNKVDTLNIKIENKDNVIYTAATENIGIEELKEAIGNLERKQADVNFIGDFINPKDIIILVTPIDSGAPKGRIILPQQQAIRDILDFQGIVITVQTSELQDVLNTINRKPKLVVTDSQVFNIVKDIVPEDIYLTSFSILMARYKGFLEIALKGAKVIDNLQDGAKVLISEGCTHHRQCDDIGTVKLPKLISNYTGKKIEFEWSSGNDFPEDLRKFDIVIHCGGCMLNQNEMTFRMKNAEKQGVAITNYGTAIAHMNGILERSIKIL